MRPLLKDIRLDLFYREDHYGDNVPQQLRLLGYPVSKGWFNELMFEDAVSNWMRDFYVDTMGIPLHEYTHAVIASTWEQIVGFWVIDDRGTAGEGKIRVKSQGTYVERRHRRKGISSAMWEFGLAATELTNEDVQASSVTRAGRGFLISKPAPNVYDWGAKVP